VGWEWLAYDTESNARFGSWKKVKLGLALAGLDRKDSAW